MRKLLLKYMPALDKLQHIFVGSLLCLVYIPIILIGLHTIWALLFCLTIAIGNEIYQKITKLGEPSVIDALATMVSPIITFIIILLLI